MCERAEIDRDRFLGAIPDPYLYFVSGIERFNLARYTTLPHLYYVVCDDIHR